MPVSAPPGPMLYLDDRQSGRIDLGLERPSRLVDAPDLVAAIIDPEPVHLPATGLRHRLHGLSGLPLSEGYVAIVISHRGARPCDGKEQQARDEQLHHGICP